MSLKAFEVDLTTSGLPTAIQLIGRRFDDATPMRVANVLESHQPWIDTLHQLNTQNRYMENM